jgi:hypothetical protein
MSLGRVGRLMVDPPVPFLRVQEMWYPWYQISLAALECLASELYPSVLDLPVLVKLPSALLGLNWLIECTRLWSSTERL